MDAAAEREPRAEAAQFSAAPRARLLACFAIFLLVPFLAAAVFPALAPVCRDYFSLLPLPELVAETALVFSLFILPLFAVPRRTAVNPGVSGVVRGAALACLSVPFLVAARPVWPVDVTVILTCAVLVGATAAGTAAAAGLRSTPWIVWAWYCFGSAGTPKPRLVSERPIAS